MLLLIGLALVGCQPRPYAHGGDASSGNVLIREERVVEGFNRWLFRESEPDARGYPVDENGTPRRLDVTVIADLGAGFPVYRFVLRPVNFPATAFRGVKPWVRVTLNGDLRSYLYAPLPDARTAGADGRIRTPWVVCEVCVRGAYLDWREVNPAAIRAQFMDAHPVSSVYFAAWDNEPALSPAQIPELTSGRAAFAEARRIAERLGMLQAQR